MNCLKIFLEMHLVLKLGFILIFSLEAVYLTNSEIVTITPFERNVKVFTNDSYFVFCEAENESPESLTWYSPKHQKIGIDTSLRKRFRTEINLGAVDLFLTQLTPEDTGVYSCVTPSRDRATFNLTVISTAERSGLIRFNSDLKQQSALEGQSYFMKCEADGQFPPKISWKVDNRPPKEPKYKVIDNGLIIRNVTEDDGMKNYLCEAVDMESPNPDAKFMNITLKVMRKPKLLVGTKTIFNGTVGEWINLTCYISAYPPATFTWSFRQRVLVPSDKLLITNPYVNISVLKILVSTDSFGYYSCIARNEVGILATYMTLLEKLAVSSIPTPTNRTHNSLELKETHNMTNSTGEQSLPTIAVSPLDETLQGSMVIDGNKTGPQSNINGKLLQTLLEVTIYKSRLETWKLEREIGLPLSPITQQLVSASNHSGHRGYPYYR